MIPDHIWIGPFRVEVGDMSPDEAVAQNLNGRWLPSKMRIEISTMITEPLRVDTLLHEGLHAVWDLVDLPQEQEEAIIGRLTPQLMLLCKMNPSLKDLLFRDA